MARRSCPFSWVPFVALALSCSQGQRTPSAAPTAVRLTPISAVTGAGVDLAAISDRDTTTALAVSGPVSITFAFAQEVRLTAIKAWGAGGLSAAIDGVGAASFERMAGWEKVALPPAAKRKEWTIALSPRAAAAALSDLAPLREGNRHAPREPPPL